MPSPATAVKHLLIALFSISALAQTPEKIRITLMRAGNLGGEPSYRFTIDGHGNLEYEGIMGVFVRGRRAAHLSKQTMTKLAASFQDAHFWEFDESYLSAATDQPSCVLEFQQGIKSKRITDYGGQMDRRAPLRLIALEDEIDRLSGTEKWVYGSWWRRLLHWKF